MSLRSRSLLAPALCAMLAGAAGCGEAPRAKPFTGELRWPPPALHEPRTVRVGGDGGELWLKPGRDYRVKLTAPVRALGGLVIHGGRNVVLVGGRITIPDAGPAPTPQDRRALYLDGQTGVVHLEGLLVDDSGGDLSEGIQIAAPRAIVQIQNVRMEGVHARDPVGFSDNHPDLIQPGGGVRELRVHRFTGTTAGQGFFLVGERAPIGRVELSEVNIVGLRGARVLLWKRCTRPYPAPCTGPDFPLETADVWVRPPPGGGIEHSLKPPPPDPTWEDVREGVPPGGDFVARRDVLRSYRP
jgi:hypothetical protein